MADLSGRAGHAGVVTTSGYYATPTTLWHEARKAEKKLMVDPKKRAERRKEYYENVVSVKISANADRNFNFYFA